MNLTFPILVLFAKQAYAAVVFSELCSEFTEVVHTVWFWITELESFRMSWCLSLFEPLQHTVKKSSFMLCSKQLRLIYCCKYKLRFKMFSANYIQWTKCTFNHFSWPHSWQSANPAVTSSHLLPGSKSAEVIYWAAHGLKVLKLVLV